jgi:hypothetical protein
MIPFSTHDAVRGVNLLVQQQVTYFVCDHMAQDLTHLNMSVLISPDVAARDSPEKGSYFPVKHIDDSTVGAGTGRQPHHIVRETGAVGHNVQENVELDIRESECLMLRRILLTFFRNQRYICPSGFYSCFPIDLRRHFFCFLQCLGFDSGIVAHVNGDRRTCFRSSQHRSMTEPSEPACQSESRAQGPSDCRLHGIPPVLTWEGGNRGRKL